jgi:hypothetical protein
MNIAESSLKSPLLSCWLSHFFTGSLQQIKSSLQSQIPDVFQPLRKWLNNVEINDANLAHHLCELIPAQCPFARKITLFGHTLIEIPPLCKLNPLYNELMGLRFRALCYLADECGEDIAGYC